MSISDKVSFLKLSKVLEDMSLSKKSEKIKSLSNFIRHYQTEALKLGPDFKEEMSVYPVLRLLIPSHDRQRGPYGIKEFTISKLYSRILCLKKGTREYNKLVQYKAPKASLTSDDSNFSDVAYSVLKNRCGKGGELSVTDVNELLNRVASKHSAHDPRGVDSDLQKALSKMSALEQKWLIRILLKDLSLGLGGSTILDIFHKDAKDLYDVCHNLSKVCSVLHNPSVRLHEVGVVMFEPFRPMLSQRLDIQTIEKDLRTRLFYFVEPKHDGERFQLHMMNGKFKYFSRNGYEYTKTYGEDCSHGILTPYIVGQFSSHVKSCILDGEMMCWNTKYHTFTTKGGNIDVKKLRVGNIHQACFCVFDILHLNGSVLTNKPLSERVDILKNVFVSKQGFIVHTNRAVINSKSQVLPALNKAIDTREEGIIIKEPDAVYKPNSRKDGWYKIKPEYTEGAMVELDMLIIGGYYGKGSQRGIVSQFLLGLAQSKDPDSGPTEFISAGKVGSGLSMEELVDLSQKLAPHWKKTKPDEMPDKIVWTKEKPDLWLPPSSSHILQVRATEVSRSDSFKVGYYLRFPRIQFVRYDKDYRDCLTVSEFHRIRNMGGGKLCYSSVDTSRAVLNTQKSPRKRTELTVGSEYLCNIDTGVTLKSYIFKNKNICVMVGRDVEKKNTLERLVLEHGGTVVQNSGKTTWCIIVESENIMRVQNAVAAKETNVLRADWLVRCAEKKCLLDLTPSDVVSVVGTVAEEMSYKFDMFGDSYTKRVKKEQVKEIISRMRGLPTPILTPREVNEFEKTLFCQQVNPHAMFRNCSILFEESESGFSPLIKLKVKFYGGYICDELTQSVTHVVVHRFNKETKAKFIKQFSHLSLVDEQWIQQSIVNQQLLPVPAFSS